jgi:outer membrane PBP1 activator LpoA protein
MAVILTSPRLTLGMAFCLCVLTTGCSLVQPAAEPVDLPAQAQSLAASGRHADAARAYQQLAAGTPAQRDSYELLSAEQWVAAGQVAAAEQALAAVSPAARTTQPTSLALVSAEVAIAKKDGARANQELDSITVPSAPDLAQNYRYLRHEAAVLTGHPEGGTHAQMPLTAAGFPDQIALLLPLSGRAEAVGTAVRDGFIAAYFEQDAASRPRIRIYDVVADTVSGAYNQAIKDGAGFIVGPLTKEDVAALAPLSTAGTPVLALNFLADSGKSPANFYQFALLPEDEARIVARRMVGDGKMKGVALLPDGEWGSRVGAAFADELNALGGTVVDRGRYDPNRSDYADIIKQTLQIHGAKGEPATHRSDVDFIFVAGTPSAERLMVSQLKFHFAGDIPVYATSDGFEPNPGANNDLDGMMFPDMPWMVSSDPAIVRIRDAVHAAWPTRTTRFDRLYAFGFDAYRLVPALKGNALHDTEIAGVTGKLRLDDHNRIRRDLDWAVIKDGSPAEL